MKLKIFLYILLFTLSLHADYTIISKVDNPSVSSTYVEQFSNLARCEEQENKYSAGQIISSSSNSYASTKCDSKHDNNNLIECIRAPISEKVVNTGKCEYVTAYQDPYRILATLTTNQTHYGTYEGLPNCPAGQSWSQENFQCEDTVPECTENELLNENNECVPFDSLMPDDFPNDLDANGQTSTGTVPTTEQGCKDMERYNSSLGMVEVLGWDYQSQTCKVVAFKCNQGRVLDKTTNKCIIPPDNVNFGAGNICVNDNWARKWTHDFCSKCVGMVGVWLPPLGHEESGMECNKAYIEYQCVADYRIKKYMEVSCGDPLPNDEETHHIDMDNLNPSEVKDQNVSNLPAIDPTEANLAIVENLIAIESAITNNLSPKIDTVNQNLSNANDKLSNIGNQISNSNNKLDGIKSSLDNINDTLNTTGEGINPSDMDLDISGLDGVNSIMDNFAENMSDLTDGITSIKTKFDETKLLLSGEHPTVNIPSGSCSNAHLNKFSNYIAPYSSIFSLVVYIGFMISIFKMIFAYMARGE